MSKPKIWIMDTSILTNFLNIPTKNDKRDDVIAQFEIIIEEEGKMFLPFVSIIEAGNHIGQLVDSGLRKKFAEILKETIVKTLNDEVPWKKLDFPDHQNLLDWIVDFSYNAEAGKGLGDHLIIKQYEEEIKKLPAYDFEIWTEDADLAGYQHSATI